MSGLAAILIWRGLQAILVALLVGSLCFLMLHTLPGDLASRVVSFRYGSDMVNMAAAAHVRQELGLDGPPFLAWLGWLGKVLQLDLGRSFVSGGLVRVELMDELAHTLELAGLGFVFSVLIGLPIGLLAGLRPGGVVDRGSVGLSVLLRCLPPFVIGILLIIALSVGAHILPAGGDSEGGSIVLPALTLALGLAAVSMRVTRTAVADVAASPYFLFARTKGLPLKTAVLRHGLRNAGVPVVTYLAYQLIYLMEGVMVVEVLFAWPGIGHGLVHAIFGRDIPVLQGTALTMGFLFVGLNTLVDFACLAIDPRLRRP